MASLLSNIYWTTLKNKSIKCRPFVKTIFIGVCVCVCARAHVCALLHMCTCVNQRLLKMFLATLHLISWDRVSQCTGLTDSDFTQLPHLKCGAGRLTSDPPAGTAEPFTVWDISPALTQGPLKNTCPNHSTCLINQQGKCPSCLPPPLDSSTPLRLPWTKFCTAWLSFYLWW